MGLYHHWFLNCGLLNAQPEEPYPLTSQVSILQSNVASPTLKPMNITCRAVKTGSHPQRFWFRRSGWGGGAECLHLSQAPGRCYSMNPALSEEVYHHCNNDHSPFLGDCPLISTSCVYTTSSALKEIPLWFAVFFLSGALTRWEDSGGQQRCFAIFASPFPNPRTFPIIEFQKCLWNPAECLSLFWFPKPFKGGRLSRFSTQKGRSRINTIGCSLIFSSALSKEFNLL